MATTRFEEMGKVLHSGQHLKQVEWRTALELPSELVAREARAADVIPGRANPPGRSVRDLVRRHPVAGSRPVLVVPDVIGPLHFVASCGVQGDP
jgi:hypothetical protein